MSVALIPSREQFESMLLEFYSNATAPDRRKDLHEFILRFQSSNEAWAYSLHWLQQLDISLELRVFAASCLQNKLLHNFSEIASDTEKLDTVRTILFRLLLLSTTEHQQPRVLREGISSCVCAFALQSVPDFWEDPVAQMLGLAPVTTERQDQRIGGNSLNFATVCEMLSQLPEMFHKFAAPVQRRNVVRAELQKKIPAVANYAGQVMCTCNDLPSCEAALHCIESWLNFSHDLKDWLGLLDACMQKMSMNKEFLLCSTKFFCDLFENSQLNVLPDFVLKLVTFAATTLKPYAHQLASEGLWDEAGEVWRMVCGLGENQAKFILQNLSSTCCSELLTFCLDLLRVPGYFPRDECCSNLPVRFCCALEEEFSYLEPGDSCQNFSQLAPTVQGFYWQLIPLVLQKLAYPPPEIYSTYSAEDRETFQGYRQDLSDVGCACFKVLRSEALEQLTEALQTSTLLLQEAQLFLLSVLADYVVESQAVNIQRFLCQILPTLNYSASEQLTRTTLRVLQHYHQFVLDQACLQALSPILTSCLKQPSLASLASLALKEIVSSRDPVLKQFASPLLEACYDCIENQEVETPDRLRAVSCVGFLLSCCTDEFIISQLNYVLAPSLERLRTLCVGTPFSKHAALMELSLMSNLVGTLDTKCDVAETTNESSSNAQPVNTTHSLPRTQPILVVMMHSIPLIKDVYISSGADKEICVKLCDLLRRSVGILLGDLQPLQGQYQELVLLMFPPHGAPLSLAKQLFLVFGDDVTLQTQLSSFLLELTSRMCTLMQNSNYNELDEFLNLLLQVTKKQSMLVLSNTSLLQCAWQICLQALKLSDYPSALKLACGLSCEILKNAQNSAYSPSVVNVVLSNGSELFHLVFSYIRKETVVSCMEAYADVLLSLLKESIQLQANWLPQITGSHPLFGKLTAEIKNKRKFREIVKQINFESRRASDAPFSNVITA